MQLKNLGVVLAGLKPEIYYALGVMDEIFRAELGRDYTLTNAVAPRAYQSLHMVGLAVDGRTLFWFDGPAWRHRAELVRVVDKIRARLDPHGYDVILEPDQSSRTDIIKRFSDDDLDRSLGHHNRAAITDAELEPLRRLITPHFHVEFDPKPGEVLWALTD